MTNLGWVWLLQIIIIIKKTIKLRVNMAKFLELKQTNKNNEQTQNVIFFLSSSYCPQFWQTAYYIPFEKLRTIFSMSVVVFSVKTRNHATFNSIQALYVSSSSFVASLSYQTAHISLIRVALFFGLRLLPYKTPQVIEWPSEKTLESIQTVSYYSNMVLSVHSISFISQARLPPSWTSPPERPWG